LKDTPDCATIILAGGKGRRLGQYKPYAMLGSKRLLQYVLETAVKLSDQVVVVIGKDDDLFSNILPPHPKVIVVRDRENGLGPMMGIYSGIKTLPMEYSLVLPCDAPFISAPLMSNLMKYANNFDAAIPIWPNGNLEPIHSVYRVSSSIQAIESAINLGEKSVLDFIKRLKNINYVPVEKLRKFDSELHTFLNVNHAKDLKTADKIHAARALSI
jgi:molybdopterin-guanine dinucleotide biosynthesis protein A